MRPRTDIICVWLASAAFVILLLVAASLGLAPNQLPQYKQSDKVLHFLTFFLITVCLPLPCHYITLGALANHMVTAMFLLDPGNYEATCRPSHPDHMYCWP